MKSLAVAGNTFREARRDRVQWVLLLYVAVVLGGAYVLTPLSMGEGYRITRDLGLAAMSLVGTLLIALVGGGMIQKEVERRTVITLLATPLRRSEFLLGKFLGMLAMVSAIWAGMILLLAGVLWLREGHVEAAVIVAGLFTFGELVILTAVVTSFSVFLVSPVLSGLFTLAVFVLGHLAEDLEAFAHQMQNPVVDAVSRFFYYALPHMHLFNLRAEAAYGVLPGPQQTLAAAGYAVLYAGAVLVLGMALLSRREFR